MCDLGPDSVIGVGLPLNDGVWRNCAHRQGAPAPVTESRYEIVVTTPATGAIRKTGTTFRHRLNRGGARHADAALYRIVLTRAEDPSRCGTSSK